MGTGARPYLYMIVGGLNGRNGPVLGIVDSGADMTCFPDGYAPLMGFSDEDLEPLSANQAGGETTFRRAKHQIEIWLPEMPDVRVTLQPTFIGGSLALWGRDDFFRAFRVLMDEPAQCFELHPH